ncbi:iron-containing redox enzyme family protein [Rosenbergiella epipactidis]|uniref:iron-containing redox enzyme family protein n=1 Tax=Rosenbergiella epipactidis TaxID=1544694 RepID=UPI001F4EE28E|nr:iron-containing redox enzyme family protein [Rosenbergiella epipactidis]
MFFINPKFRKEIEIAQDNNTIHLIYREQGCQITVEDGELDEVKRLIECLNNQNAIFEKTTAEFANIDAEAIILSLDKLGLLEEGLGSLPTSTGALSGEDFYYSRLLPTATKWQSSFGTSPLFERLVKGEITRNEIIGFAIEYYHLVKMSSAIVSSSLSHNVSPTVRKELTKLFIEEYNHDEMMAECLSAVGIPESELLKRNPLPSTFSANASLAVYARQHPLSFYSSLFLFETPSHEFNSALLHACQEKGLPEKFYKPILKHSDINEDGDHDLITLNLLREVPAISQEEQHIILVNVCNIIELLHLEDRQIVAQYSATESLDSLLSRTGLE